MQQRNQKQINLVQSWDDRLTMGTEDNWMQNGNSVLICTDRYQTRNWVPLRLWWEKLSMGKQGKIQAKLANWATGWLLAFKDRKLHYSTNSQNLHLNNIVCKSRFLKPLISRIIKCWSGIGWYQSKYAKRIVMPCNAMEL